MHAIDQYDPTRGVKLITYATHHIDGHLRHFLRDRVQIIKEPAWLQEMAQKVRREADTLTQELGREPTDAEVAAVARPARSRKSPASAPRAPPSPCSRSTKPRKPAAPPPMSPQSNLEAAARRTAHRRQSRPGTRPDPPQRDRAESPVLVLLRRPQPDRHRQGARRLQQLHLAHPQELRPQAPADVPLATPSAKPPCSTKAAAAASPHGLRPTRSRTTRRRPSWTPSPACTRASISTSVWTKSCPAPSGTIWNCP